MKEYNICNSSRRRFVSQLIRTAAVVPFLPASLRSASQHVEKELSSKNDPLNILILGGTSFLGPHQIAYALDRGHRITTFTRGKTKPTIYTSRFEEVEQLVGNREDDLSALQNRKWDAVIDNSGYRTHWTRATAELLRDSVGLYMYTSTVSVYYPYYKGDLVESMEVNMTIPESFADDDEKLNYEYGVMKATSEVEVTKYFGENRSIIIRPTFMTGPADRTNRFIYWPTKLAKGGLVIIPGKMRDPVQYIDVRDVAEWMIRLLEAKNTGTYNAVGPASAMTSSAFVYGAHAAFNSAVEFVHINDDSFLADNEFHFQAPWIRETEKYYGIARASNQKAIENGLTYRPLAVTMRDVHDWWYSDSVKAERRNAFMEDPNELHNRQSELIAAWNKLETE